VNVPRHPNLPLAHRLDCSVSFRRLSMSWQRTYNSASPSARKGHNCLQYLVRTQIYSCSRLSLRMSESHPTSLVLRAAAAPGQPGILVPSSELGPFEASLPPRCLGRRLTVRARLLLLYFLQVEYEAISTAIRAPPVPKAYLERP
jgi:hypothetical protein